MVKKFNKKIYLASPKMHGEEQEFVKKAFDTNWLSTIGENIDQVEKEMSAYIGVKCGVGLCNGTSAIHIAVRLLDIHEGDIVLCSDMTFAATVNPVTYEKATCVFIDSEKETWNMDPKALEIALKKYKGKVKAVIVADLYGSPSKLEELISLCDEYKVPFIEDAAEALSATYKNKKLGSFGLLNILSFNGNKLITGTSGGMLLSDNEDMISHAKKLSTQARDNFPWYEHTEIGYNYRLSNVLAGIVRGQILHIDEHKDAKKDIYCRYKNAFSDLPVKMNPYLDYTEPNYWLSCLTIDENAFKKGIAPEKIRTTLLDCNVESRPIWKPMHMQPIYKNHDFVKANDKPINEDIFKRGICLPSDINMTEEQQMDIIDIIKSCFK